MVSNVKVSNKYVDNMITMGGGVLTLSQNKILKFQHFTT